MNIRDILNAVKEELTSLDKHLFDVLDIKRPATLAYAKQLAKVISKFSPLLGNMIEFSTVDILIKHDWIGMSEWIRQDPGFPDAFFKSGIIQPNPDNEIKAWFPFVA